jgi:cellulose synthase/poly-beta-1,6-N-acetylglucosamine synthase-like glycosyltransferase
LPDIAVLITVWKRNYLEEQLNHLVGQSVPPLKIWILQNEKHIDVESVIEKFQSKLPEIHTIRSEENLKFFGRFSIAAHMPAEYLLIIDDDVIPGEKWIERCLELSLNYNSIVSCSGRIIQPGNFSPEEIEASLYSRYFIGDNYNSDEVNLCDEDTIVDYGCNSYFFKREWLRYFWSIWPYTFQNGEDIHLSSSLKITQGIRTIVPRQDSAANSGNLKKYYSQDAISSWRQPDFYSTREEIFRHMILEEKWKPILWDQTEGSHVKKNNIIQIE